MLFNEMMSLNQWLLAKESNYQPIAKLQKLSQILNANIQPRNQNNRQPLQPFTEEKNIAIDAIGKLNLSELSKDQIQCLSIHKADQYMGKLASEHLKKIFMEESHDLAFLAKNVAEALAALNQAKTKIAEVANFMGPYSKALNEADYLGDKARFSIILKDGVQVETLKDLEIRSKEWSSIIHGIGTALDVAPNEFKVLGARNGSLIIDLYMCAAAIVPIGFILNRTLSIIERFALSMKRIESIYKIDANDPAFNEISEEIQRINDKYFTLKRSLSAKKIAEEILNEKDCPEDKRPEAEALLEGSIRKILNHLRKGGELDAFVPKDEAEDVDDGEDDKQVEEANNLINEFRHKKLQLNKENILKLLEHVDFEDPENDDD